MRLLTLNLHNPVVPPSGARDATLGRIADLLDASGADLFVLTECDSTALRWLGERLGCIGMAHAPAPHWGNGLLTRTHEVLASEAIDLPRSSAGEPRSAIRAQVRTPWGVAGIVGTHLDHLTEPDRLHQLAHLEQHVNLRHCLLLGDLNSLRGSDYSPASWAALDADRIEAGLTPAATDVTGRLIDELGMQDAHDARAEGAPFTRTCPYETRIDYILLGPASGACFVPDSYRVLDAIGPGITDHNAVCAEIHAAIPSE